MVTGHGTTDHTPLVETWTTITPVTRATSRITTTTVTIKIVTRITISIPATMATMVKYLPVMTPGIPGGCREEFTK